MSRVLAFMIILLIRLSTFQQFSVRCFLTWTLIKKPPGRLRSCSEVLSACRRLRSLSWRLFGDFDGASATAGPFQAQLLRQRRSFSPEAKCYKHECVTFSTLPTYFPAICCSSSSSSRPVIAAVAALLLTVAACRRLPGCLGDLFLWPCVGCLFIILSLNNLKSLITKNDMSITQTNWKLGSLDYKNCSRTFFLSALNIKTIFFCSTCLWGT